MKKLIVAAVLLVPYLANADTDALEEIVVTASPLEKSIDELVRPVNVLTGEELEKEAAATLGETLNNQIGINSASFGPGVGVPVIRGLSGSRVEILQNSTSVQDVSDTSSDHAVATEALLAERIEVVRGPAVLRYGNGAIGGVVNVIDNRIPKAAVNDTSGALQLRFNSNNDERVVLGKIDTGNGAWAFHADAVMRESNEISIPGLADHEADDADETTDGFIENTHAEADSGSIGFSYTGDNVVAGFSVSVLDSRYGLPPGGHGHEEEGEEEEEEEEEEEFVDIELEQTRYDLYLKRTNLGNGFLKSFKTEFSITDYEHTELEIEGDEEEAGTFFDVSGVDGRVELIHNTLNGWDGAIGFQYTDRDFEAIGEEAFVPPSTTESIGIYLIEETSLSFADLELGARFSSQSLSTAGQSNIDHDSFNASASLAFPVADAGKFAISLFLSERAPTAEELLSDGEHIATNTFEIGDPTLDTETANTLELSYRYNGDVFSFNSSLYHSDFGDYIFQMSNGTGFDEDTETCQPFAGIDEDSIDCLTWAQEDATFTGIELEGIWQVSDSQSIRLWADAVRAELDNSGDVPRIPAQRIGLEWDYSLGPWDFELAGMIVDDQNRPGLNEEETEGYTRIDAGLRYQPENWSAFINIDNLTDEDIRNATSFTREIAPEPGRAITLGLTRFF